MIKDNYTLKGLRKKLIEELRDRGINDENVLKAMSDLPRHYFIEPGFEEWAYKDVPFSIGEGQTISQPYTVALMTQLLEVKEGDKILEIGTGSGYQASIISLLGGMIYTLERHETLCKKTRDLLTQLGMKNIKIILGDGYSGFPAAAPYDKIIVTAGAPNIPKHLLDQLKNGGMMVIPVGEEVQEMFRITKIDNKVLKKESFGKFQFVPFLPGVNHSYKI